MLLLRRQFFRDVNMGKWPAISAYMLRCASRKAYAKAYEREAPFLVAKCQEFVDSGAEEEGGLGKGLKSIFKR